MQNAANPTDFENLYDDFNLNLQKCNLLNAGPGPASRPKTQEEIDFFCGAAMPHRKKSIKEKTVV